MRKIKILHTADIHFDTPFSGMMPSEALKSKEELKRVFEKIISICLEINIDILLIAGDVFDNLSVNKSTLHFIRSCLEQIKEVRVFISPGNHDPFNDKSFYNMIEWPSNVYVFKGEMECVVIDELSTVVWGAAFNTAHVNQSMMKNIKRIENKNNIMVIHGEISNNKSGNEYNPITEEEILNSNMDYVALGHRHKFSEVKKIGNTYYSYSGCPQGRGFDELDDKGVVLIELENKFVESKFIKTSIRNYYEVEINIENLFGYNEVTNKILSEINKEDRLQNFYKIILKGEIREDFNINGDFLKELLKGEFYYLKVIDKTEIKLDMKELMNGYSIKSIFARKMYEMLQRAETDEEKEAITLAIRIGIQSLVDEEVNRYEN